MFIRIIILELLLTFIVFSQEVNITSQLKLIESGDITEARTQLNSLLKENPNDPSIKFLDGVLKEDGQEAMNIYNDIHKNFPASKYADAALYRLFSFNYSVGAYTKAEELKETLLSQYPASPYIKAVNRNLPDESTTVAETNESYTVPSTKPPAVNRTSFEYTIQAGAFLNVSNARNLNSKFKEKGLHSEISPKEIGGSILNVVTVGRFKTRLEADNFLITLKNDYNLNGRIIAIN